MCLGTHHVRDHLKILGLLPYLKSQADNHLWATSIILSVKVALNKGRSLLKANYYTILSFLSWKEMIFFQNIRLTFFLFSVTCMVHALTSSGPAVKKYCRPKALYPWTMIFSSTLKENRRKNSMRKKEAKRSQKGFYDPPSSSKFFETRGNYHTRSSGLPLQLTFVFWLFDNFLFNCRSHSRSQRTKFFGVSFIFLSWLCGYWSISL